MTKRLYGESAELILIKELDPNVKLFNIANDKNGAYIDGIFFKSMTA